MNRLIHMLAAGAALGLSCGGCKTLEAVTEVGTQIAVDEGKISEEEAGSIRRTTGAVARSFTEFTPEQEYFIGRSVAAAVLQQYRAVEDDLVTQYLNRLGPTSVP